MQAEGPCIIGGEYLGSRFSTQLNKNKEGGNLQPSKQQEKGTTLGFVYFLFLFYLYLR